MTCEKAVSKLRRKLIVPKMNDKCKKIKCANVDEPQCVRMTRQDLSLTIHIVAANKCEMEYMKCHDDVEAKIVPMKYCSHNVDQTAGKKINKTGKAHIRIKRRIKGIKHIQRQAETSTTEDPKTGFKDNNNKSKHLKLKKSRTNSKKLFIKWKNEDSNVISKDNNNRSTMKGHGARQHARQDLGYPFSSETDSDMEHNERKKITKGVAGHLMDMKDEDTGSSMQYPQLQPKALIAPSMIALKGNRPYMLSQAVGSSFWGSKELGPVFPILSEESGNISKDTLTEADKREYEEMCPTVCPSRDVMVCGKCQHGIYKTFLSVCHLRMFTCNHEDEVLLMISRYPCVLSAPYISETDRLKGRVVEPGDDDKILRFIMCRDQGKLGTDDNPPADPRCDFKKKPVRRGIGIEFSSSSSEKHSSSDTLGSTHSSEWSRSSDNSSPDLSSSFSSSGLSSSGVVSDSESSSC